MGIQTQDFIACCGIKNLGYIRVLPNDADFTLLLEYSKVGRKGVYLFVDSEEEGPWVGYDMKGKTVPVRKSFNAGKAWAAFIREHGYRVDEIYLGGNPNHNEEHPHHLTLFIWYVNKEKNKESVYVGKQEEAAKAPANPSKSRFVEGTGTTKGLGDGRLGWLPPGFGRRGSGF